jgi:hypothetical protein
MAPETGATPPQTVSPFAAIENDVVWIRTHVIAILLSVALIAGSIIGGVSLFEDLIERHDERIAAAQQKKEGVDTTAQQTLMAQLQQDRAAEATRDAAQTALIQTLVAQMAQQRAATAKQVATDSTLDAQSAASRLAAQTKASPGDITVSGNNVIMPLPITRTVVADLDLLPQAQSDVTNLQAQLAAQQTLTNDAKSEAADENKVIAADKDELIATIKADNAACKVQVDKQAAKDRKRGLWASVASFVAGTIVRGLI